MTEIEMPEGTHLAYYVSHESWWWQQSETVRRAYGGHPQVSVSASAKGAGGGVEWGFSVVDMSSVIGKPALKLHIYDEGWEAFACMAPFFAALADRKDWTLDRVRGVLDSLGAVDETEREDPDADDDKF
jgi:hypothetical protein